jgi:hypothetical protein
MQSIENAGHPRFLFALFCQVLVPNVAVMLPQFWVGEEALLPHCPAAAKGDVWADVSC